MGTTLGAEELGLCPHGLARQVAPGATTKGFASDMAIFEKRLTSNGRQKYSARPITLAHDEMLTNEFLNVYCGML